MDVKKEMLVAGESASGEGELMIQGVIKGVVPAESKWVCNRRCDWC